MPSTSSITVHGSQGEFRVNAATGAAIPADCVSYGDLVIRAVNLADFMAFYELTPEAMPERIDILDLSATFADGTTDDAEHEIRMNGIVVEGRLAAEAGDYERMVRLHRKAPDAKNLMEADEDTLFHAVAREGRRDAILFAEKAGVLEWGRLNAAGKTVRQIFDACCAVR